MKITEISYEKVFNLGNYSNEKIGVRVQLAEGESPLDAFAEAKKQVEKSHLFFQSLPAYERAKKTAADPNNNTGYQVAEARAVIETFETNFADYINKFMPASRQLNEPELDGYIDEPAD